MLATDLMWDVRIDCEGVGVWGGREGVCKRHDVGVCGVRGEGGSKTRMYA